MLQTVVALGLISFLKVASFDPVQCGGNAINYQLCTNYSWYGP